MKRPTQHEINRIIIGNQLTIMRALILIGRSHVMSETLKIRVNDTKAWWRMKFGEEVGFETSLGDEP